MIKAFVTKGGTLCPTDWPPGKGEPVVWIDLMQPTEDEEKALEERLGVNVPTREEMQEIEISSRLYRDGDSLYMTAMLPALMESGLPSIGPVTFLLTGDCLVTIRYHEPSVFQTFPKQATKVNLACNGPDSTLVALLDATIDRLADILERVGANIDGISRSVFRWDNADPARSRDFQWTLEEIGRQGDPISKIRDSLATLERLAGFLGQAVARRDKPSQEVRDGVKTLMRDVRSLTNHSTFLSQKVMFLLDATLGMINMEQNTVIKILSVAATVFLPPTLIASIYGMNFRVMPELGWPWGYPAAIGLMVVSAILPYVYLKKRKWL